MGEVRVEAHADGAMMRLLGDCGPLAVTSYQAGAVILASVHGRRLELTLVPLPAPMGIATDRGGDYLLVAGRRYLHVWRLGVHGWCYESRREVPARSDLHDVVATEDGCAVVATGRDQVDFFMWPGFTHGMSWTPPFRAVVDEPGDRIHLNGLAVFKGRLDAATCFTADAGTPWREQPVDRGALITMAGETIVGDLVRPHTPRYSKGWLHYLDSGRGQLHRIGYGGAPQLLAEVDGFARGLAFTGAGEVLVGVSRARHGAFEGMPLTGAGECAVRAFDRHGRPAGALLLDAIDDDGGERRQLEEIYDLKLLYGHGAMQTPPAVAA